jgi:hypothetical protein
VQGQQERQLARQLLSAALQLRHQRGRQHLLRHQRHRLGDLQPVCQGTSSAMTVTQCISSIDAFNNGVGTGCHDRNLPLDTIFPGGTRCTRTTARPSRAPPAARGECNSAKGTAVHRHSAERDAVHVGRLPVVF